MQTFLPHESFQKSAQCLDRMRLGKQRVEAYQILNCISYKKSGDIYIVDKNGNQRKRGWLNHSAVLMWNNYPEALKYYFNVVSQEWINRGYNHNMGFYDVNENVNFPDWLGNENFHKSHQSNLLRKYPEWYEQFNWNVSDNLPYIWPT